MDVHEIAEIIASAGAGGIRFRQATVVSVQSDGTFTATIAGSSTAVSGIRALADVCPLPGSGIWLVTDGVDVFAFATMGAIGPAFASIMRPSDQSLPDATDSAVNFTPSPTIVADTHGMFAAGSPSQLTAQVPGVYRLTGSVSFANNGTGVRSVWLTVAGTTVARVAGPAYSGAATTMQATADVACALGAVVQLYARQSSGAALAASATGYAPSLSATWVRSHP